MLPGGVRPTMFTDSVTGPLGPVLPLGAVRRAIRALGFWLAVALPLAYLPLLSVASVGEDPALLLGMLSANLVALAVGHGHEPTLSRAG